MKKIEYNLELLKKGEAILKPGKKIILTSKEIKETEMQESDLSTKEDKIQIERLRKGKYLIVKSQPNDKIEKKHL